MQETVSHGGEEEALGKWGGGGGGALPAEDAGVHPAPLPDT